MGGHRVLSIKSLPRERGNLVGLKLGTAVVFIIPVLSNSTQEGVQSLLASHCCLLSMFQDNEIKGWMASNAWHLRLFSGLDIHVDTHTNTYTQKNVSRVYFK